MFLILACMSLVGLVFGLASASMFSLSEYCKFTCTSLVTDRNSTCRKLPIVISVCLTQPFQSSLRRDVTFVLTLLGKTVVCPRVVDRCCYCSCSCHIFLLSQLTTLAPAQDLPFSQIFPTIVSLPASGLTPRLYDWTVSSEHLGFYF